VGITRITSRPSKTALIAVICKGRNSEIRKISFLTRFTSEVHGNKDSELYSDDVPKELEISWTRAVVN
ncbi:unnamed protein product, partial [Schistosoma curassoni]|uniref:Uncharacterized protein n=1 Tax=Schistosoma curassoni TaxID=6186 RepID=A0A183KPL2_9TREM